MAGQVCDDIAAIEDQKFLDEIEKTLPDPWKGSGHKTTSTALHDVPEAQLRSWMSKARRDGGAYKPTGWGREFTIANMSAELARRKA